MADDSKPAQNAPTPHSLLLMAKVIARSNAFDIIERLHIAFVADEVWTRGSTIRALEECSAAAGAMKDAIDAALTAYTAEPKP